jgi:uncharacterized protein (DUF488 family)
MSEVGKQPTYKRQRHLLAFVRQLSSGVTATDLQKLMFLHAMTEGYNYYEFVPYKYGSYSFQLAEDLDILRRDGYLFDETRRIKAKGEYPIEVSFRIAQERGDALIRRAYREYTYYTINSEITERLFRGEELERLNNARHDYNKFDQILFTIGYKGKSIEAFVNTLIQNDIRLLCDVRKNPFSRKFGFSEAKLKHILQTVGIEYAHIPNLGIESDKRSSLNTPEDYRCLFESYTKMLSDRRIFLDEIYTLLQTYTRIALMCFELEPGMCHRHVIRDFIVKTHHVGSVDLQ